MSIEITFMLNLAFEILVSCRGTGGLLTHLVKSTIIDLFLNIYAACIINQYEALPLSELNINFVTFLNLLPSSYLYSM